jgi:hypothetical protein
MREVTVDGETIEIGDDPILPSALMIASGLADPIRYDLMLLPLHDGDMVIPESLFLPPRGARFITARKSTTAA